VKEEKGNGYMKGFCFVVLVLALMVSLVAPAMAASPTSSLTLSIGSGQPAPFFTPDQPHGLLGELKLTVSGRSCIGTVVVRNSFYDGGYLFKKSKVNVDLEFPFTHHTSWFLQYENSYRTGDEWGWAGLRFHLL